MESKSSANNNDRGDLPDDGIHRKPFTSQFKYTVPVNHKSRTHLNDGHKVISSPSMSSISSHISEVSSIEGGLDLSSVFLNGQALYSVLNDPRANKQISPTDWFKFSKNQSSSSSSSSLSYLWEPSSLGVSEPIEKTEFSKYYNDINSVYSAFSHHSQDSSPLNGQEIATTIETIREHRLKQEEDALFPDAAKSDKEKKGNGLPSWIPLGDFDLAKELEMQDSKSSIVEEQEHCSQMLDAVEQELQQQISQRSRSFFEALSFLEELQTRGRAIVQEIQTLRKNLLSMDQIIVQQNLTVPRLRTRSDNYNGLVQKLTLVQLVRESPQTILVLLHNQEMNACLDLIISTQHMLSTHLNGVQCFRNLGSTLQDHKNSLKQAALKLLLEISTKCIEGSSNMQDESGENVAFSQLSRTLAVLIRLRNLHSVVQEDVRLAITSYIEERYEQALDEALNCDESNMKDALNALTTVEYVEAISLIFDRIRIPLSRLSIFWKALDSLLEIEFTSSSGPSEKIKPSTFSSQSHLQTSSASRSFPRANTCEFIRIPLILQESEPTISLEYGLKCQDSVNDFVTSCFEVGHVKCANLLLLRSHYNQRMSLKEFLLLYQETNRFIQDTEKWCHRQCYGLRAALTSQSKSFLDVFHASRIQSLSATLDNEQWIKAEVPAEFQKLCNQLCANPDNMAAVETVFTQLYGDDDADKRERANSANSSDGSSTLSPSPRISVNQQSFYATMAVLLLLKLLHEYCKCAVNLRPLSSQVLRFVIEVLQIFNSRTCQLVLGAGAMHLQRLKSITAKHLAIAAQSTEIVSNLIPSIRKLFSLLLETQQHSLLADFERLCQDYANHHKEIMNKFVAIMRDRVQVHSKAIRSYNFDSDGSLPSTTPPLPPFAGLVKETETLHRVMTSYLPRNQVREVFQQIFAMFHSRITDQLASVKPSTPTGRKRLYSELETFLSSLSESKEIHMSVGTTLLNNFASLKS